MSKEKFEKFIKENNLKIKVIESEEKTHTAQEAADVHGVSVENIVKSILVKVDERFVLFLVPGHKKIDLDEKKKTFKAKECRIAKPEEVKDVTGYSIGGVPPFGHKEDIETYIEKGFLKNEETLAAGGSPNSIFKIKFEDLKEILESK